MLGYSLIAKTQMKIINYCNKIIEYSFYLLFFLVPLALTSDTSELFEFNKLWVTFILTIIIGAAWFTKMIVRKEFKLQRTPLDIPIALFLVSEIISTFISLDTHVSIWGYYSRFNGGLLSILSYVFLYYAYVSNLRDEEKDEKEKDGYDIIKKSYFYIGGIALFIVGILISSQIKTTTEAGVPYQMLATLVTGLASFALIMKAAPKGILKRTLFAILSSAAIVVLWGLPSHFGYDPTCLLFRGTLDVSCWTSAFQPKVRIFSTLGQPDWMAAYLAALLPILMMLMLNFVKGKEIFNRKVILSTNFLGAAVYFVFFYLTFLALMYTGSKSAIIAIFLAFVSFFAFYAWYFIRPRFEKGKSLSNGLKMSLLMIFSICLIGFFAGFPAGFPFGHLNNYTWDSIRAHFSKPVATKTVAAPTPTPPPAVAAGELGGTDSGIIRYYVWKGAIDIWQHYPIFGTGVETYAFAYYMFRPRGHNMTSEWQYLYNKAHNEFLNYLATTGTVGIVTYLLMIGAFLFVSLRYLYKKRGKYSQNDFIVYSILVGYGTILVTNFGGFSVVITNIFFYMFPALLFIYAGLINYDKAYTFSISKNEHLLVARAQKISMGIIILIAAYFIYTLINYWQADRNYYYGFNYDQAQQFQKAYPFLKNAVDARPGEPVFQDEYAYNNAVLATYFLAEETQKGVTQQQQQQYQQIAKQLIQTALDTDNKVITEHPNDVVFWKTRVRMFYVLSQVDPSYLPQALTAIKKAAQLAPTDPDVSYNLGVLYGQTGDFQDAIKTLQHTVYLKPDYPGGKAYYALAIFYHQLAIDKNGKVVNQTYNQKAIDELKTMEKLFGVNPQAQDALKSWGAK